MSSTNQKQNEYRQSAILCRLALNMVIFNLLSKYLSTAGGGVHVRFYPCLKQEYQNIVTQMLGGSSESSNNWVRKSISFLCPTFLPSSLDR